MLRKDEPVGRVTVAASRNKRYVSLVPATDVNTVVIKNTDITKITRSVTYTQEKYRAPIEKGEVLGQVTLYLNEKEIAKADLVAGETAPYSFFRAVWEGFTRIVFSGWMLAFVILIIAAAIAYVWLTVRYNKKRKRHKK